MMQLVILILLAICAPQPSPPRATGELTAAEQLFQGEWEIQTPGSNMPPGTLRIDQREFSADTLHGAYTGYVTIRPDASPAQIDFTIQNCECKFDGLTALGIYYEDGGDIVFVSVAPEEPRPEAFEGLDETKVLIQRATRPRLPVQS